MGAGARSAMLLVETPREAAVPPCAAPLDLPMSTLTKLNFTDYSVKVNKTYPETSDQRDNRLNYEQALASVARLNYELEQSVTGSGKLHYADQNRLAYDPAVDTMCADPPYLLQGQKNQYHIPFKKKLIIQ